MKQRIRVVGIVKRGEEFLLLKKARGRVEELPSWELPTGKIKFGEQPEEAMSRSIYEFLGVQVGAVKLKDAITFSGLAGASRLGNLYIVYEVTLSAGERLSAADRYSAYKFVSGAEISKMRLESATISVLEMEQIKEPLASVREAVNGATVYVDRRAHV